MYYAHGGMQWRFVQLGITMRISKKTYYYLGGMSNPLLYRKEMNGKWYHYLINK